MIISNKILHTIINVTVTRHNTRFKHIIVVKNTLIFLKYYSSFKYLLGSIYQVQYIIICIFFTISTLVVFFFLILAVEYIYTTFYFFVNITRTC